MGKNEAVIANTIRTILNVHGDREHREAIARLLRSEGLQSRNASSVEDARHALAQPDKRLHDLVLLDASLADAERWCQDLRRSSPWPPLVLTRSPEAEPPEMLLTLADDVLAPPLDPARWIATIRAWIRAGARLVEARAEADRWRAIFDAIDEGMAMIGLDGFIIWCNSAMASLLRDEPTALVGQKLTDRAAHLIPSGRQWPLDRTIRSGARSRDEWELGHHWYRSSAAPMRDAIGLLSGVVTTLEDVTPEVRLRHRIAQVEAEAEARSERIDRLERDARLYQALAGIPVRPEDGDSPRRPPLSQSMPEVFCDALEDFGRILDFRLHHRSYRNQASPDGSALLSSLAERLATAGAGPRDVIEIHAMALRQRSSGTKAAKINAYAEEAQVAVLELMGRVAEHYRAGLAAATRDGAVASDRSPDSAE